MCECMQGFPFIAAVMLIGEPVAALLETTMPPHLHPRSRMTSSLFATTVVASFFVVALPHILPCPAPGVAYADSSVATDEKGRRVRRKHSEIRDGIVRFDKSIDEETTEENIRRKRRECPVPKPGGMLGELLGFHKTGGEDKKPPR